MIAERAGSVQQPATHELGDRPAPNRRSARARAVIVLARECERLRVVLSDA
jgi:hypothetical protein